MVLVLPLYRGQLSKTVEKLKTHKNKNSSEQPE